MKFTCYLLLLFFFISCAENEIVQSPPKSTGTPWALLNFTKVDSLNPILVPDSTQSFHCPVRNAMVNWEERNVLNPSAVVRDGKVYLLYRAQDHNMTSRLGLAISDDGLHFTKRPEPVLFPDEDNMKIYEWNGGIEDPRLVESEDGTYFLTYTSYNGKVARLCLASSKDLLTWTKHGLVLGEGKYKDTWSKSGAIIARQEGHRMVATKINGKYWMYFGDTDLFMASSDDLIHWTVAENEENKKMVSVLHPRPGFFDSRLVEPGPYALIRDEGILLIYNGSNAVNFNDTTMPKFTYSAGQALYDKNNPYKLLARTDSNFIQPDKHYEKVGEVNEVCFVEGLVFFNSKWILYYGTADSKIAVAVRDKE
ncbi:MAG: glycosidase [Chitinophagaceae bacterium]|nr:glycosidase [Chitinophagaceae bacterium]